MYRPRIDRISQHALRRGGVCSWGGVCSGGCVCSWGECLLPGGVCSWGVSTPGGVCSRGVYLVRGVVSAPGGYLVWRGTRSGTPPVDRHTPVNILPCPKLRLRAVKVHNPKFYLLSVFSISYVFLDKSWKRKILD